MTIQLAIQLAMPLAILESKTIQPIQAKKFVIRKMMATKDPRVRVSNRCKTIKTSNIKKFVTREPASFLTRSSPSG